MNRHMHQWFGRNKHAKNTYNSGNNPITNNRPLYPEFNQNVQEIRTIYGPSPDVVFRPFMIGGKIQAELIYIEGLSNVEVIDLHVLSPLMQSNVSERPTVDEVLSSFVSVSKAERVTTITDCIDSISTGIPILFFDGASCGIALYLTKWEKRGIEEPSAEGAIRGPREGFTETVSVNMSQLRRIIKNPALKMEAVKIGKYSKTYTIVAYIDGVVYPGLVDEVKTRLKRIEIDGILESGYIEELIEDNPLSPFPQLLTTERPDIAASSLLEGRVIILVEGSPTCLVAPTTFFSLLQAAEDYYQHYMAATFIRWIRYLFTVFSLLLPSFYVAILSYHHEMVPTSLLLSMAASRETVPFPAVVEALIMELSFEVLREAGVRLPKQVGPAVSIVGALVVGQAAVQAGLVSAPMVIVVAITGISSFMMPRYVAGITIRMLRFPIMLLGGTLGLLGVMLALIVITIHLCSLRSFGVPYLAPLAPAIGKDYKDVLVRAPWWKMKTRPHLTGYRNEYREKADQKPGFGKGDGTGGN